MRITNEKGQELIRFRDIFLIASKAISSHLEHVFETGDYERKEIDLALANADPGDTILELGAGVGALSSVVLSQRQIARFICVEANKDMVQLIKKNHQINNIKDCKVIHGAMTTAQDITELDFYTRQDFWTSSLIRPETFVSVRKVPAYDLSETIQEHRPNFLICDIEGGEFDLFIEPLDLSSVEKICLELHSHAADPKLADLYAFFSNNGFQLTTPALSRGVVFFRRASSVF